MDSSPAVYFGESVCQGTFSSGGACTKKAYYLYNGSYRCGIHSTKAKRTKLPKNPHKDELAAKAHADREAVVEERALKKRQRAEVGEVTSTKLRMMKPPTYLEGYRTVFPNFKQQNRKDGFGCMTLSPKFLGPIDHGMPGIPIAKTLENYHQGAKFWEFEFFEPDDTKDDDSTKIDTKKSNDKIKKKYLEKRKTIYADPVPYRHKWSLKEIKAKTEAMGGSYSKNHNIPRCSVYYTKDGEERRYSYLECRYFYCHWYERLAPKTDDFKALAKMVEDGISLNIVGYDGYTPSIPVTPESLWVHYNDTSRPFGHELVLLTLLVLKDSKDYPWNRFYRENANIYKNVI